MPSVTIFHQNAEYYVVQDSFFVMLTIILIDISQSVIILLVMLTVSLSVIMISVIMLNVVAPWKELKWNVRHK
jgi:hypothetical protein